jgi:cellulose synthase/poly-beta-1,6-N-acetylglucosamine synthase-like glycosyltransferase
VSRTVSVLIPAYNERRNIAELLTRLSRQRVSAEFKLNEIVVVTSGCTDGTEEIVKQMAQTDSRIKLMRQKVRDGKASAINFFLKNADSDIIVMESADTLPEAWAIDNLLRPLLRECVGMTAGRPIPLNKHESLIDRIGSLLWHVHHLISLRCPPKVGELVAFKNIVRQIPEKTAADEESIAALIQQEGFEVVYVPDAIVYNKSPRRISEFLKQRERIHVGHLWIKKHQYYVVPSLNLPLLARTLLKEVIKNPIKILTLTPLIGLEIFIRISGMIDFYLGREVHKWEVAESTKDLR